MHNPPAQTPDNRHPLERDPELLERIVDVMWAVIHTVLHRTHARRRRSGGSSLARLVGEPATERVIQGGDSPEDILAEALSALFLIPEHDVTTSWRALAVTIAKNKAKGSLRAGRAGLRATQHRPELTVVSGDQPGPPGTDDEPTGTAFDVLADPHADAEAEFLAASQQLELLRLARELLDDRDRAIFLGLHFQDRTRRSLADEFHLTPPGVVHIYKQTAKRLYDHPRFQQFTEGGAL